MGSIRISMGRETTMEEVEYLLDVLPGTISRVRNMSTAYIKGGAHAASR